MNVITEITMIEREILDDVKTIITHAHCPDGVASAIILHDALPYAKIVFVDHTELVRMQPQTGVLFCDIAPPRETASQWVDAGAVVLDHHAKQADVVAMFGARGRYADLEKEPGVSGAMLAFREVWAHTTSEGSLSWQAAHQFARLAGIRDTWQTQDDSWRAARMQAEALRFFPWSSFVDIRHPFSESGVRDLQRLLDVGDILVKKADERALRLVETAFGFKSQRGSAVAIVPSFETSDAAELIGEHADLVIGFHYIGGPEAQLKLSMRSRQRTDHTATSSRDSTVDVGDFCKTLGGGGHVRAAGATIPVRNGDANPFQMIRKLVDDYERGLP